MMIHTIHELKLELQVDITNSNINNDLGGRHTRKARRTCDQHVQLDDDDDFFFFFFFFFFFLMMMMMMMMMICNGEAAALSSTCCFNADTVTKLALMMSVCNLCATHLLPACIAAVSRHCSSVKRKRTHTGGGGGGGSEEIVWTNTKCRLPLTVFWRFSVLFFFLHEKNRMHTGNTMSFLLSQYLAYVGASVVLNLPQRKEISTALFH